jgi:hypothetical protein
MFRGQASSLVPSCQADAEAEDLSRALFISSRREPDTLVCPGSSLVICQLGEDPNKFRVGNFFYNKNSTTCKNIVEIHVC